jgi:uncharacterized membrane protein YdjX (TVP38/TMEM64 family)
MGLLSEDVDSRRIVRDVLLVALVGASVLWAVYRFAPFLYDPTALRGVVRASGSLGPLVFVALQALQVVFAPIPGQLTAVAGGFLFGWYGLLYSIVGVTVGSAVAFWLSRRLGRPYVESALAPETLDRFDGVLEGTGDVAIAVFFVLPGLPDDVVCFLAGLTPIGFRRFLVLSLFARLPAYALATMLGSSVAEREFRTALVLLALFGTLSVLAYRYGRPVVERLSGKRTPGRGSGESEATGEESP